MVAFIWFNVFAQNVVIEGYARYFMVFAGPFAQVNQLTAFAAKWAMWVLVAPLNGLLTGWTLYFRVFFSHRIYRLPLLPDWWLFGLTFAATDDIAHFSSIPGIFGAVFRPDAAMLAECRSCPVYRLLWYGVRLGRAEFA